MSRAFRRGGGGKKRDAAEPAIVDALRAVGAIVRQIGGAGCPDLLVEWRGIWTPLEVKTGTARRTAAQEVTRYRIVRTPEEALQAIGVVP